MKTRLSTVLHAVKTLSAPVIFTRTLRRAGIRSGFLDRLDMLHSPDAAKPTKAPDILFEAMRRAGEDPEKIVNAMEGSTVLEIGCGRFIGFAALSATAGAKGYIGADPGLRPDLLAHATIQKKILEPALTGAARLVQKPKLPVDVMLSKSRLAKDGVTEALSNEDSIGVCLSISCLEHIDDIDQAAQRLSETAAPGAVHAHLVNFSNHLDKAAPFAHLYEMPPERFKSAWQGIVNGLRHTDLEEKFRNAGLSLRFVPLDRGPLPKSIDPYWTQNYSEEVLTVRTGLLISD